MRPSRLHRPRHKNHAETPALNLGKPMQQSSATPANRMNAENVWWKPRGRLWNFPLGMPHYLPKDNHDGPVKWVVITPHSHRVRKVPFTQDAEHLATDISKLWDTLWSMGVFTQVASNIKGFARKSAHASCVNGA